MLAAAVAFRSAGASWPIVVLIGMAAIFAIHPPPVGPIGLACFAAGTVLVERWRGDSGVRRDDPADPVLGVRLTKDGDDGNLELDEINDYLRGIGVREVQPRMLQQYRKLQRYG